MEQANILRVDDHPGKLLSYEAILRDLGENLLKAHSANEALECLLKTDIAVVLMDVCMPDVDGFQLADMITQHPCFQDTAIIFISGVQMTDLDRLKGYEHGAVDYISVPVIPELLRAKVRVFVERYRKARELSAIYREMQTLSRWMLTLQDEERRRIARELHDSLGQDLTAAKMMVDRIQPKVGDKIRGSMHGGKIVKPIVEGLKPATSREKLVTAVGGISGSSTFTYSGRNHLSSL